jgi:chromate transporter
MKTIWNLFRAFFSVGLFTFGGGYAMLPMLQKEVVERHGWVTETELLDCYAIAQCTPGVIAVNTATYVGYKVNKTVGSAVATIAVVLPSLLIITTIALLLSNFSDYAVVNHAFTGIRVAVAVLVGKALISLYKKGVKGALANAIVIVAFLCTVLTNISPVILVLAAVLLSVILRKVGKE